MALAASTPAVALPASGYVMLEDKSRHYTLTLNDDLQHASVLPRAPRPQLFCSPCKCRQDNSSALSGKRSGCVDIRRRTAALLVGV